MPLNVVSVTPTLLITFDDESTQTVTLTTIPQTGIEATQRFLATRLKPDPDDPTGPPISAYAESAESTLVEILTNLANELLAGTVKGYCRNYPSETVQAAIAAVESAQADLEATAAAEAGL